MSSFDEEVLNIMNALPPPSSIPKPSDSKQASTIPWYEMTEDQLSEVIKTLKPCEIQSLRRLIAGGDTGTSLDSLDLKHPFSMVVAGPSGAGKTRLVKRILESDIISPKPQKVIWCYAEYQPLYDEMKNAGLVDEFVEGLDYEQHIDGSTPTLIVIDDLQDETGADQEVANLFKRGCHHRNLSVVYIVQNIYFQAKKAIDIRRNSDYVVAFKNPQDRAAFRRFIQNSFPDNVGEVMKLYTSLPAHGYLLLDFKQDTDESARIRTGITKGEKLECFSLN